MLPIPALRVLSPETLEQAVEALATPGSRLVAGGTDLLPNLKHRLLRPTQLVSLHRVQGLRALEVDPAGGVLRLGAGLRLAEIAGSALVQQHAPSLAEAASLVASPQIRNMATLGGNLSLDTRCRYVNQSEFWRGALGGCLKSEGSECHVIPGGQRCVAAMSADCVPVLAALGARVSLFGAAGIRELPLLEYYRNDGADHLMRAADEILQEVRIPLPEGRRLERYVKWRVRGSIDFPLVSVALSFELEEAAGAKVRACRVVVAVLGARPREVRLRAIAGRPLDAALAATIAEAVHSQCRPLENVPYEAEHRRHMLRVLTRRAIEALARESGTAEAGS